jgi:predicted acyltransferase
MIHAKLRVASLDLFRGYAVLGMVIVNFVGNFKCTPRLLKHTNDYCSFADTVMPHFLFAVGFALQIVWNREAKKVNSNASLAATSFGYRIAIRCLRLMILSFLVYVPLSPMLQGANWVSSSYWLAVFKRDWFQTLTHIAVTSIWVLAFMPCFPSGFILIGCVRPHRGLMVGHWVF